MSGASQSSSGIKEPRRDVCLPAAYWRTLVVSQAYSMGGVDVAEATPRVKQIGLNGGRRGIPSSEGGGNRARAAEMAPESKG